MTLQELIFYCAKTNNGKRDVEKCYEKGRADAIDDVISLFESIFEKQNKVDSKYAPTVVINGLIFGALEQLKEQEHD